MIMKYTLLLLILIFNPAIYAVDLPEIGSSAGSLLSLSEEKALGNNLARKFRTYAKVMDDIEVHNYITHLGQKLVSYSDSPQFPFHFFVVNNREINAFAMPGGLIAVYSGLVLNTRHEGELAAVIAHEIAHVTQRHIIRGMEKNTTYSIPLMALGVLGALMGIPEVSQAILVGAMAGSMQLQINFTRAHEREADNIGMQILAKSGFTSKSMPDFFKRLQEKTRFYSQVPEFLRTHPVTLNRIAESYTRAESYNIEGFQESTLYHLFRAKLVVLTSEKSEREVLQDLQTMFEKKLFREEIAIRYALALALLKNQKSGGIQEHIDWLMENDGDRVMYRLLQAQLAILNENPQKAQQIYETALEIYPADQLLSIHYVEFLLAQNQAERAKTILLKMSNTENLPVYYRLLSETYRKIGREAEADLALAENLFLKGKTKMAIQALENAREQPDLDFYIASRIEARYQTLITELKVEEEFEL